MSISDEILMAYADGELDAEQIAAVELAMQQDPTIAAKVQQHQTLRFSIHAAFAPILEEELPARFSIANIEQSSPASNSTPENTVTANVLPLDAARQQREAKQAVENTRRSDLKSQSNSWSWPEWGSLAAMLILGVMLGNSAHLYTDSPNQLLTYNKDGNLIAGGVLASALTQQLASDTHPVSGVKIGLSFLAKDGNYCRSFGTKESSGLACREQRLWTIPLIVENQAGTNTHPQTGELRPAGTELSPLILELIDQKIAGQSLDTKEEKEAQAKGWK